MFVFIRLQTAIRIIALLTIGLFVSGSAVASDIPMPTKAPIAPIAPAPPFDTWTFSVTPYAWLTNINGSASVANQTKDIDVTFDHLVRHFAIPKDLFEVAGYFEARNGRFSIFNDIVYEKNCDIGLWSRFTYVVIPWDTNRDRIGIRFCVDEVPNVDRPDRCGV